MIVKDCQGQSGGLAVFWKKDINLQLRSVSQRYIDTDVVDSDGFVWRFTGFYGEPRSDHKEVSWKAMRTLNTHARRPWLVAGDFNEVLLTCEKEGGQPKGQIHMDRFREALEECQLDDLGYVGDAFTWRNNSHACDKYIKERLDRAVANVEWRTRFPAYKVINGEPRHSDHRPLVIEINREELPQPGRRQPNFRFEASWVEEEQCKTVVENAWKLTVDARSGSVGEAVREVGAELWDWSRNILGDLEKRIKKGQKSPGGVQEKPTNPRYGLP